MSEQTSFDQAALLVILDAIPDQLMMIGADGTILAVNTAWRNFHRHHQLPDDCVGQHYHEVFTLNQGVPADVVEPLREGVRAVLSGSLARFQLVYAYQRESQLSWFELDVAPFLASPEARPGALIMQRDISEQKALEAELLARANHDELTGLANRRRFLLEGAHLLALAQRQEWHTALVYIDLDNFKFINDHYGHQVGDEVLVQVAAGLRRHTRESDLLARLGGDEFVVLLNNVSKKNVARIVQAYQKSFPQSPIPVQGSFGVAYYPEDGLSLEALLVQADQAMYHAKAASRATRRAHHAHGLGSKRVKGE